MTVEDNGSGCPYGFQCGGGLDAMMRRLHEVGGRLFIQARPHFKLEAVVKGRKAQR